MSVWTDTTDIFIVDVGKVFNFKQMERLVEFPILVANQMEAVIICVGMIMVEVSVSVEMDLVSHGMVGPVLILMNVQVTMADVHNHVSTHQGLLNVLVHQGTS